MIKEPNNGTWTRRELPQPIDGERGYAYENPFGILVFSTITITSERKQEWHISISEFRNKPSPGVVAYVRHCFDANDFEEDNHIAKRIVCLWKPVVKDLMGECPCK
jgi:hypothetical protein